jgi:hypothetical protein
MVFPVQYPTSDSLGFPRSVFMVKADWASHRLSVRLLIFAKKKTDQ